jgi:hypothetical protein
LGDVGQELLHGNPLVEKVRRLAKRSEPDKRSGIFTLAEWCRS